MTFIQLPPIYEIDTITSSLLSSKLYTNKKNKFINKIEINKKNKNQNLLDSVGVLSSDITKKINVIKTQPLNLYVIHENKIKFILKFESIPIIAKINYNNASIGKSKFKHIHMNYVIELYVLTKQGKLWQIYLNMDENEINLEKNTLKDDYGKVLKKKKTSKSSSCSLQNLYPIIININSTNIKRKNNKFKKLSSKDYYQHNNYNKRIHITMIHQSNDLYNFCFYENYMILYSYNSCIQYIDLLSQRIASEKIRSVSSDINITVDPYTLYSTDISSISNESVFLTIHEQDKYDDNLFINDSNYFMSKKLFQALFNTEKKKVHLIGTTNGEVYWIDNLYNNEPRLLINLKEPIKDFHILNLKNYNETQVTSKNQYSANESLILSGSPKKLKNNVLMIIGKNGSVLVYKIISKESKDILFNKKYHITSPIYSSCIFNNYLFITSKYYDGSRKITFYDLYNEENEEEFKEILIPKLFPSAEDIQYFKCLSIIDKNISFNQLHLNGLWTSGERDISNLLLDEKENNHGPDLNNPSKIIMPILDDINRLSTSIEEYKKDHKLLNRSIACMNETIFFLISFIDYINKNEYKELPIVCKLIMKYNSCQSYFTISVSLMFKLPITNHWILNMNINPYIEEIDSKSTIYNVTLPNLKKNEQWSYTFNYKNRYQSFPIDITLRLCLSIPECGDIIIPFFVKKFDNLDFIYPSNEITKDFNIERTNPLLEETSFNCKQEFINEVRHIFNSNSDDIIIESGVKKQTDIYVILVDCNKEGIFLEEIQKKFLFLTLINPEINKSDFEEIAKADNEVIFKIPGSNYPIKIVSDEILIDQIPQNIQTIKLSIFGDDLSAIHSVRQCLLDRIHTISNNIQMNKIHINTNDVDKSIIYEIKKAIIFTLDSVMLNQKNKHEKMEKVNSLYNKKSETKEYKLKTFKYIKRELQNLYKKFEDLCDDNKDEITINSLNSKMIDMYNNLMELNGLLQTLDSIHMEVCFIDRSYFLYV